MTSLLTGTCTGDRMTDVVLGCPNFTQPPLSPDPQGGVSRSLFFPDGAIFPDHPRFRTLTRNIRERRGEKVAINIPIFKDTKTQSPFRGRSLPVWR
ncbi:Glutamate--cysteine ligase catalytic subunit [Lamellibrachia satsuma]|nr:Glutamate--cysteine ligase catalytic subunit [Lamellibrachia satsuma]